MLSLNIETSSNLTSVSLSDNHEIIKILNKDSDRPNHCEFLAPMINKLFDCEPFSLNDITQVRVNMGPGNLSSLRVGLATANTISSIGRIPIYGISSFLLYAFSYRENFESLITLFDLRNNMFAYGKFIKVEDNLKLSEQNSSISAREMDLIDFKNSIIIGTGVSKLKSQFNNSKKLGLQYDSNYSIDSSSLAKVNLEEFSSQIIKKTPIMPFNSFSFVS